MRDEQVFGLRAVDRVAETPAAESLITRAVSALRKLPRQTSATLTARRDRADKHAVADVVAGNTRAEFFNHTDRLMPDDESGLDGMFAAKPEVRASP